MKLKDFNNEIEARQHFGEKPFDNWEKEFEEIYPIQVWNKVNKEQAIFITPTLQKSHKELVKKFIQNLLDKREEEIKEKANAYDEDGEPVKIFWS